MAKTFNQLLAQDAAAQIWTAKIDLGRIVGSGTIQTKTLLFSTRAIPPALKEPWHEDRIVGTPSLTVATSGPGRHGQGRQSYGTLTLAAPGGYFDNLNPPNWYWIGRPVTVAVGFAELPLSKYRPIFSGLISDVRHNMADVQLSLADPMQQAWNKTVTEGDLEGSLPDVAASLLDMAGITDRVAASWNAWAVLNDYPVWLRLGGTESVGQVLSNLLDPLACAFFTDHATGRFRILVVAPPTDSEAVNLTIHESEMFADRPGQHYQDRLSKLTVKYLAKTGDTTEYAEVSRQNNDIRLLNALAVERVVTTALTTKAGAEAMLDRLWGLYSAPRRMMTVATRFSALGVGIGAIVVIDGHPQFGANGRWRAVGQTINTANGGSVALELFR